jgi:hypothetical protein
MAEKMKIKTFDDILTGKAPELREKYFNFGQFRNLPGGPVAYVVGAGNTTAHFSSVFRHDAPAFFLNPRSQFWMEKKPGLKLAVISGHHLQLAKNIPDYDALTFKTKPAPWGNGRVAGVFLNFIGEIMGAGTVILAGIDFDDEIKKDRSADAININDAVEKYRDKIQFINLSPNRLIKITATTTRDMVLKYNQFFDFGGGK